MRLVSVRPLIAVMGTMVLAFHPRLYFAAYNNFYDLSFLSFCVIMSYYNLKFLESPNRKSMFCAAFLMGLCIDIRIVAVMFFPMTLIYGFLGFNREQKKILFPYALVAIATIYLFWPVLWLNPIENFIWAWNLNSNIGWNGSLVYFGDLVKARDLPWDYNFIWIGLTTPLFVFALVVSGTIGSLIKIIRNPIKTCFYQPKVGWFVAWAWAPLLAPLILKTTLFDGWRHHYFVFPALVGLGCLVLDKQRIFLKKPVYLFVVVVLLSGSSMIATYSSFPHCNIYFNPLYRLADKSRNELGLAFEMDYWGVSYLEGFEAVLKLSDKGVVRVKPHHMRPGLLNWKILSDAKRRRIELVDEGDDYDYFISNYRFRMQEFSPDVGDEVFSKSYLGTKYLTVRKKE